MKRNWTGEGYVSRGLIGIGAFGTVFKVQRTSDGSLFALKSLHAGTAARQATIDGACTVECDLCRLPGLSHDAYSPGGQPSSR